MQYISYTKAVPKPAKQHQRIANVITKGRVPNFLLYP
jgi:hypothetical protein